MGGRIAPHQLSGPEDASICSSEASRTWSSTTAPGWTSRAGSIELSQAVLEGVGAEIVDGRHVLYLDGAHRSACSAPTSRPESYIGGAGHSPEARSPLGRDVLCEGNLVSGPPGVYRGVISGHRGTSARSPATTRRLERLARFRFRPYRSLIVLCHANSSGFTRVYAAAVLATAAAWITDTGLEPFTARGALRPRST